MSKEKIPAQKAKPAGPVTWAQMLRDVLTASINKGQFPFAILALVTVLMIWKMSEQDVAVLVFRILDDIERWYLIGYLLFVVVIGGWFWHANYLSRKIRSLIANRNGVKK